ncbi:Mur ligase family protein [Marilutibacter aestuarii]|uniref:UDP-N-acetylmuramoyl-tripeptide--D-alanyl-D-alanine ligase n=1 Tax=Marilutibacter aestuarii TaxID=1706195 RepID=A0A508A9X7_9GAMM|nr:Mur ligase family protein [Lysobacter aestuarii]TQD46666.1 hypothetical protein FKV25_06380 [Lysobacter aestuarii]
MSASSAGEARRALAPAADATRPPSPGLAFLLDRARGMLEQQWRECTASGLADPANCMLFFATCNGDERAHVIDVRASDFEGAWALGAARLEHDRAARGDAPCWLRVEFACAVQATTWARVHKQMAATKRNYWRRGIAFDARLERAFLPLEIAGNALLYDNRSAVATPNPVNLRAYARRRFGAGMAWPEDPERPVWLFDTRAVFADADGVHAIEHAGRNRGYRTVPDWGAARVMEVIRKSTGYLARQVRADGRYAYGCFPCFDREIPHYNTLRHASSTYALLEGWELTRDGAHKAAIDRALDCLRRDLVRDARLPGGARAAFLVDVGDEIKLGGNAVALLALAKHAELTGERGDLPLMERLATGIVHMQDASSGEFVHVLAFPSLALKARKRIVYYDGEAAFGLMRLYALDRNARWLEAVEKAFGHFIAVEHWRAHDHWLGYCVNELTMHRPLSRYYRFGLDNVQGHLDFVRDRITTFPTLLELMMAARNMIDRLAADQDHARLLDGFDLGKFDEALEARARYLLSGFFWPELAMFFRNPRRVLDGFFIRHHGFRVRIDDVEHYLSGYVAYWKHLVLSGRAVREPTTPPPTKSPEMAPPLALPADLEGQANGRLDEGLLRPIHGGRLHWRAAMAWDAMRLAAQADGVLIEPTHVLDTYRNLGLQMRLFEKRYTTQPPARGNGGACVQWRGSPWWLRPGLAPAALPGSSMHGWGLAVDVDRVRQEARWRWLREHASAFGWCWPVEGEPWHLCYVAGDHWPAPVVAHARRARASPPDATCGWTASAVEEATGGTWLRPPREPSWRATGLCYWSPSMLPGHMVVARFDDQPLGLAPTTLARLHDRPAAVIVDVDLEDVRSIETGVPVLGVDDRKHAVLAMGEYARSRMAGQVLGVTGSSGKTTTVAMLADVLACYGPTNRTRHNANLPPGIAWNLASMAWDARFTVLEMAVGRMGQGARLARPDVAVVTNVTAAHLRYHGSVDEVARRKSRIFSGMRPGGLAVLNADLPQCSIFASQAARYGLRILRYGRAAGADVRLLDYDAATGRVRARVTGREFAYRLGAPGGHMAMNSLACLAALSGMGLELDAALPALAAFRPLPGRGEVSDLEVDGKRLRLIDDAYNANPASMTAALALVRDSTTPLPGGRRVLVLGDMRELEPEAEALHASLADAVRGVGSERVLLCGPYMATLQEALGDACNLDWFADVESLGEVLPDLLRDGDLVLVKSSAGTRLSELVGLLRANAAQTDRGSAGQA